MEKNSLSRVENQQIQPTYVAESGSRTQATLVRGECSHHYATAARQVAFFNVDCHLFLLTEQLQAYKQASIKHTQAKEKPAVSWQQTLLQLISAYLFSSLRKSETICMK